MSTESVKISDEDKERAKQIQRRRGDTLSNAIGAALEGWERLPAKVQDEIWRGRLARKHAEPAAA